MAKALTVKTVDNLKAGTSRKEVSDGASTGLWLVVQPSGAKSWAFRYRSPLDGKPKKLTIGPYSAFTLVKAREAAAEAQRLLAKAIDPVLEKKTAKARALEPSDRIDALLNSFIKRHVDTVMRDSTANETKRLIERHIRSRWRDRKAETVSKHDVLELLDEIIDGGASVTANRVFSLCRLFFNWLVARDVIAISPISGMRAPVAEVARDRVLTDDEIRWLWHSTAEKTAFNAAVRTLLLTGQRRGEVKDMVEGELRLDGAAPLWSLPPERVKNKTAHDVPLSPAAVAAIQAAPRIGKSSWIFTENGENAINGWSKAKTRLDAAMLAIAREDAAEAGVNDVEAIIIPHWTIHDIRRTVASGLARLGVAVQVTEAVLNHRSGTVSGIVAVYQRHDYADEKRSALQKWAEFILVLNEKESANGGPR